jgi:hypothetical protein
MTTMRFTKTELLQALAREDRSYRLGLLCTHWIRDIERYAPSAASLARGMSMVVNERLVSDADLAELLEDPARRQLVSSDFVLTLLHALIRVPFELLSDYCEDYDRTRSEATLLNRLKAEPWYKVARVLRNTVSHNFHVDVGPYKAELPLRWRTITITHEMDGKPVTFEALWHRPGYELFLEMKVFAEALPV